MSERIHNGPYSLRMWLEDGNVGMEWHCPPGQCGPYRHEHCPHVVISRRSGGTLVCNNPERQREAMLDWAIREFMGFAKLYKERA